MRHDMVSYCTGARKEFSTTAPSIFPPHPPTCVEGIRATSSYFRDTSSAPPPARALIRLELRVEMRLERPTRASVPKSQCSACYATLLHSVTSAAKGGELEKLPCREQRANETHIPSLKPSSLTTISG